MPGRGQLSGSFGQRSACTRTSARRAANARWSSPLRY